MFCPNCAAKNSDEARFCRKCGAPMAGSQAPAAQAEEGSADSFFKWVGYIVVFFFVLALLSNC